MLVILLVGGIAIVAAGLGLLLSRRGSGGGVSRSARNHALSPRQREIADLFAARLRSGAIGIPDLIRLLRKEGRDPREINEALLQAMSRFPQFKGRKEKFQGWVQEADKQV